MKHNVKVIFMLCNLFEDTRVKCDKYWPDKEGESLCLGDDLKIVLLEEKQFLENQIIERSFEVSFLEDTNSISYKLKQYHVICWPDHSIPDKLISYNFICCLMNLIDFHFSGDSLSPILVHCSAGIGRTGTLIALYNCYHILNKQILYLTDLSASRRVDALIDKFDVTLMTFETDPRMPRTTKNVVSSYSSLNSDIDEDSSNLCNSGQIAFSVFTVVRKLREQRYLSVTDLIQYKMIYSFLYDWLRNTLKGSLDMLEI